MISTKPKDYDYETKIPFLFKRYIKKLPPKLQAVIENRAYYHRRAWDLIGTLQRDLAYNIVIVRPTKALAVGKYDSSRKRILATIEQGRQDARKKKDQIEEWKRKCQKE